MLGDLRHHFKDFIKLLDANQNSIPTDRLLRQVRLLKPYQEIFSLEDLTILLGLLEERYKSSSERISEKEYQENRSWIVKNIDRLHIQNSPDKKDQEKITMPEIGENNRQEYNLVTTQPTRQVDSQLSHSSVKGGIDFAIITIREDEYETVLQRFAPDPKFYGERRYVISRVDLGKNDYYLVAIARCTDQGQGPAQDLARDMIEQLDPDWLLVVGIAGGVPDDEFTLGDVVVAKRLLDFSVKAVSEKPTGEMKLPEYDVRGWAHPAVEKLCAALPAKRGQLDGVWNSLFAIGVQRPGIQIDQANKFYGDKEWKQKVKTSLAKHFKAERPPRFTTAVVAGTEELVKSAALVQLWMQDARSLRAVEMELAGVYQAAQRSDKQYPVLAVRGISDIVGYQRDSGWTAYACHSAAAFAYELIRSGFIKPSKASQRGFSVENLKHEIKNYLGCLINRYGKIVMRGIVRNGKTVEMPLEYVYVPMVFITTLENGGVERRKKWDPTWLGEMLTKNRRIVFTGGPGSSKTTTLLYVISLLSSNILFNDDQQVQKSLGMNFPLPVPIYIPLNVFAGYRDRSQPMSLENFVSYYLKECQSTFHLPEKFFEELVASRWPVILMLDGLDEVVNERLRSSVRQEIENLVSNMNYDLLDVLITCRKRAYKDNALLGKNFQESEIQNLTWDEINSIVKKAYSCIYDDNQSVADEQAKKLLTSIVSLERIRRSWLGFDVEPMISSPLKVRLLLIIHYNNKTLPSRPAELYREVIDLLLEVLIRPNYLPDEEAAQEIIRQVDDKEKHLKMMQCLAFHIHKLGKKQSNAFSEENLRRILKDDINFEKNEEFENKDIEELITITRMRSPLLEERQERKGFYHFMYFDFQEYLAASFLAQWASQENGIDRIARFFEDDRVIQEWWHGVILLTVSFLSTSNREAAEGLVIRLAGINRNTKLPKLDKVKQESAAKLAYMAVLQWPDAGPKLRRDIEDRYHSLSQPSTRIEAPLRWFEVDKRDRSVKGIQQSFSIKVEGFPDDSLLEFVKIPSGLFWMGSDEAKGSEATENNELPQHALSIHSFFIARYPVTLAQFHYFCDQRGYKPPNIINSFQQDAFFDLQDHPVVEISWYDAIQYCEWLEWQFYLISEERLAKSYTDQERQFWWDLRNGKLHVRLPSEAEWEMAARGSWDSIKERRIYPWGDTAIIDTVNSCESRAGGTSPVGQSPDNVSPYGVFDLSGNVWEWTRSLYQKYPYNPGDGRENEVSGGKRVLRGGSWRTPLSSARCSSRLALSPSDRQDDIGFRVALGPCEQKSTALVTVNNKGGFALKKVFPGNKITRRR